MSILEKILGGYRYSDEEQLVREAVALPREDLYEVCHQITEKLCGRGFDTCSIINTKSGLCSEDCKWCAQSRHFNTSCDTYPALESSKVLPLAKHNSELGIKRFSLVASGKRPSRKELEQYCHTLEVLREQIPTLQLCASLGLAGKEAMQQLAAVGCTTYHCNMESAPSFFPTLCSTHTQQEKEETLAAARAVGMRCCSGGIIGMGETRLQRAEMALYLQRLGIESIPLNILHPISGTPLGNRTPMDADEVLLSISIFRLANPTAFIRFSGGRALLSEEVQRKALYIGVNAAITGGLLTTTASVTEKDMSLFTEVGYDVSGITDWDTDRKGVKRSTL